VPQQAVEVAKEDLLELKPRVEEVVRAFAGIRQHRPLSPKERRGEAAYLKILRVLERLQP
jgi:ribosomal protein S7